MGNAIGQVLSHTEQNFVTIESRAPIRHAVQRMSKSRSGVALVTSDGRLVGILTDRDVVRRVVDRNDVDLSSPVADVMSAPVHSAPREMNMDEAIELMAECRHRHLPVLDSQGAPVGIVTMSDLLLFTAKELEQSVLDLAQFIAGPAASVQWSASGFRLAGVSPRKD